MNCEMGSNLPSRRPGNHCVDAISGGPSWGSSVPPAPEGLSQRWQMKGTGNQNVNDVKKKNNLKKDT